jgi:hypothetical protein
MNLRGSPGMRLKNILLRFKSGVIRLLTYLPISDRLYIQLRYWLVFGRRPDLDHPRTYTEKIQWYKLYGLKPAYALLADKYAARSYFRRKAGESYLPKLLGVYDHVEDIPFHELPQKFVLKATHSSGWNILCHSKDQLDIQQTRQQLKKWLSSNYYWVGREVNYRHISPRIICEEMLPSPPGGLLDYKIVCFAGEPQFIEVDFDRFTHHTRNFYDLNWQRLPFECAYPSHPTDCARPSKLKEMLSLAENLAAGILLVRIDLYLVGEQIFIGEMTFTPDNGFAPFKPAEWDRKIGECLKIQAPGG